MPGGATPIKAEHGLFLTIGIPGGQAGKRHAQLAIGALKRAGYRAAVTSDEAIVAAAEILANEKPTERTDPQ